MCNTDLKNDNEFIAQDDIDLYNEAGFEEFRDKYVTLELYKAILEYFTKLTYNLVEFTY